MKITHIEYFTLRCKANDNYLLPTASFVTDGSIYLKVFTDSNIVGIGEPCPYGARLSDMIQILQKDLIPNWIGSDPLDNDKLTTQYETGLGYGNIGRNALIAGFSQALWDIRGKFEGKPLFKLINTNASNKIQAYASAGMWYDNTPLENITDQALKYQSDGFTAFKLRPETPLKNNNHFQRTLKPPPVNVKRLVELLNKIHNITNGKLKLMVDAGCRLDFKQALYLCKAMEELNCVFLEEPIQGHHKEYAQLKSKTKLSLAGGESLVSKAQFKKWIESGVLDYLQPDSNLAGINEIIAIDKLVKKKGLKLILHNWTNDINNSANIHLAAALESCSMVEANLTYNPLRNNLVKDPMIVSKGGFTLSDKAGLGIELNQSIIDEHSFNVILKK